MTVVDAHVKHFRKREYESKESIYLFSRRFAVYDGTVRRLNTVKLADR
jgi:hypothetical protein